MITVENLTKRYGSFTAVDDISFTLASGTVTGLPDSICVGVLPIFKCKFPMAAFVKITGIPDIDNASLAEAVFQVANV